jgi:glycosyltransferase involved in cell wall biosynthesis
MILLTIKERYSDKKLYLLGNRKTAGAIFSEFKNSEIISGVTDEKLVQILNECELTIHPQKWEPFGYVVAESIACGTPVLALNHAGPKEIIDQMNFGILAKDTGDFISILNDYCEHFKNMEYSASLSFPFDIECSGRKFLQILEKIM